MITHTTQRGTISGFTVFHMHFILTLVTYIHTLFLFASN